MYPASSDTVNRMRISPLRLGTERNGNRSGFVSFAKGHGRAGGPCGAVYGQRPAALDDLRGQIDLAVRTVRAFYGYARRNGFPDVARVFDRSERQIDGRYARIDGVGAPDRGVDHVVMVPFEVEVGRIVRSGIDPVGYFPTFGHSPDVEAGGCGGRVRGALVPLVGDRGVDSLQVLRDIERAGEGVARDASFRVVYQGGFRRPVVGEQGYRAGGVSYPDALQSDLPGGLLIHS